MKNRIWAAAGLALAAVSSASATETIYAVSNTSNAIYKIDVSEAGVMSVVATITNPGIVRPYGISTRFNGDLLLNGRGPCTGCSGGTFSRFDSAVCDAPDALAFTSASGNGLVNPHGMLAIGDLGYMVDTYSNRIVRYDLAAPGTPVFLGSSPTGAGGAGGRSIGFHRDLGQVFVSDCCVLGGLRRYTIAADGSLTPAGTITGNGLNNPHGFVVSPWGELFVCNINGNSLSRFLFDASGAAIPNGVISGFGLSGPVSAIFLASGELQVVGHVNGVVSRFTFDNTMQAVPAGTFNMPTGIGEMTTLGATASFAALPARSGLCPGDSLSLSVLGAPAGGTYQWQHRTGAGAWTNLADGPRDLLATVSGSSQPVLALTTLTVLDAGAYRCVITTTCGMEFTNPAVLTLCEGDADCDADTDSDDITAFFAFWENGDNKADVDGDGDTDSDDIVTFFGSWDGGC